MVQKKSKRSDIKREPLKKGKKDLKKKIKGVTMVDDLSRFKNEQDLNRPEGVRKVDDIFRLKEELYDELSIYLQLERTIHSFNAKHMKENIEYIQSLGYVFSPSDERLVDHYLRKKNLGEKLDLCPIKDIDAYGIHPRELSEKLQNRYFFTRSCMGESQPCGTNFKGHWIHGKKEDVFAEGAKVGVKQILEYCEEGDHKCEYKINSYQLDPVPDNVEDGLWFLCNLCNGGD